ncbi:MAG: TonB family protein [Bacteroidota bacterium]
MAVLIFCGKLVLSTGLLYVYYYLFLRNKRFHHYNRFYLLAVTLFSLVIPFINIPIYLFTGNQQHSNIIQTLKVITASGWEEPVIVYARQNIWGTLLNVQNLLWFIYLAGFISGMFLLIRSIFYINGLKKKYRYETVDQLKIYNTSEPGTPFSFFKSIFWDKEISFTDKQGQQIFRHEMFHVKEKHSADILLLEILCCSCWFNPFFHLIKKELKAIHEFLADEYAVSANNRYEYAELLVLHAINHKAPAITHPFFHNQIKRRITMITQSNLVRRSGYISRIMALPLLLILVSAFAVKLTSKSSYAINSHRASKNITVVIDAGHGGVFTGAHNTGLAEKDINLEIAQKIKQLSDEYNVNVVLTRNNDNLVGSATNLKEDLQNRVEITNDAKADAFISIHVNQATEKISSRTGFQAYISRRKSDPKSSQLASTILTSLKNVYAVDDIIQQRDEGIMVVDKSNCPSVLLECGYINNEKDAAFITDKNNQEKIARNILEGIVKYSNASLPGPASVMDVIMQKIKGDTISAQEVSELNVSDVKSVNADMTKTTGIIYFKNGDKKYFNIKEVNDYYSANKIEDYLKNYRANVNMQDSVVDIIFHKDTTPASGANARAIIFTKVEFEAVYPGGNDAWPKYLFKTLKYPQKAIDKEIQGTVIVQFIVDATGKISDVKTISGPAELKAESIRVVKESGVWIPATDHGVKVRAYKRQPITYKMERQGGV